MHGGKSYSKIACQSRRALTHRKKKTIQHGRFFVAGGTAIVGSRWPVWEEAKINALKKIDQRSSELPKLSGRHCQGAPFGRDLLGERHIVRQPHGDEAI